MDIFSLGCTIAELFLEGTPLFTFSQLLRYRRAEFDPIMVLEKIEDDDVKTMIRHMIQLDPSSRSSAATYLEQWRDSIFPESFYTYLHPYMTRLTRPSVGMEMPPSEPQPWSLSDADFCIHSIWRDYSQITEWMSRGTPDSPALPGPEVSLPLKPDDIERLLNSKIDFEGSDVFLLITDVICANMRNLQFPSSKLKVLDLLVYFGHKIKDEFILDRLVPYTMCFLDDDHPLILVNTIQTLPHLLSFVQEITIAEANVFLEFIFPGALRGLSSHPDATVRASYVRCLICLGMFDMSIFDCRCLIPLLI